jgi:hypothetical protein
LLIPLHAQFACESYVRAVEANELGHEVLEAADIIDELVAEDRLLSPPLTCSPPSRTAPKMDLLYS